MQWGIMADDSVRMKIDGEWVVVFPFILRAEVERLRARVAELEAAVEQWEAVRTLKLADAQGVLTDEDRERLRRILHPEDR